MDPQNEDDWIILAIIHLSHQVSRIESKVDLILKNSQIDFSQEDQSVLGMTQTVEQALGQIPTRVPPT